MPEYDLAIIGAGINGAGIARDAALRGLRLVVLEQNDLCSGTSAASSRLIHGGLRYLEYGEIPLVYESLHERRNLRKIAAHLVRPIRINIPIYESAKRGPWLVRLGMIAYDILSMGKVMPRHDMLSRTALLQAVPGLKADGLRAGARYYDAQVSFAERLVLENLLAARAAGADILTYHQVSEIQTEAGKVRSLAFVNKKTGERGELRARVVVNAAGPWVDEVLRTAVDNPRRLIGGTKGSHIIVGAFEGAPTDAFYVEADSDGRPFFIIPWNGLYLIGTTDIRYKAALSELRASAEEISYLLAETNRVFPSANLTTKDIHYAYAGVRPLPYREKGPESAITRKHIIKRNKAIATNLLSIVGGKLTTYRHLAEQTVDRVGKIMKRRLPECRTHDTPLPGGWGLDEARDAAIGLNALSDTGTKRLLGVYGGRATQIVELAKSDTAQSVTLDEDQTVLAAEVAFAFREEFAQSLSDVVHRRLMLGLSADQGRPLYEKIAALAADEQRWEASRTASELEALLGYSDSLRPPAN